jgi:hypothetical protein
MTVVGEGVRNGSLVGGAPVAQPEVDPPVVPIQDPVVVFFVPDELQPPLSTRERQVLDPARGGSR